MTLLDITQYVNIFIILVAAILVIILVTREEYKQFAWWGIPVALLLINSLLFRVVFLVDKLDTQVNMEFYNLWSDIIHSQDKITIIIYATALLLQRRSFNKLSVKLKGIASWRKINTQGRDKNV